MQLKETKQKNVVILTILGPVSRDDRDEFEERLSDLLTRKEKYLLIDCNRIEELPVNFAPGLVCFGNSVRALKGGVMLRDAPESFRFLLKVAKADSGLEFKSSSE